MPISTSGSPTLALGTAMRQAGVEMFRYASARDPDGGTGSAQIGGSIGRDDLDQALTALATRSFRRCPADAGAFASLADIIAIDDEARRMRPKHLGGSRSRRD